MTCEEFNRKIKDYLEDKLPPRELDGFLKHAGECPACYHELETNFMIERVLGILNEREKEYYNFPRLLADRMEEQKEWLKRRHLLLPVTGLLFLVLVTMNTLGVLELFGFSVF